MRLLLGFLFALIPSFAFAQTEPFYHDLTVPAGFDPIRIGTFTLTERSGESFQPEQLRGKVWIAHFFFTTCPGPCVRTMPNMQKLQTKFAGKPDIALVSITVRSAHDTDSLLRDYADSKGADPKQWLFLTGDEEKVHDIIRKQFLQAVEKKENPEDPNNDVTHTPNLILIDRTGIIRGFVDGSNNDAVDELIRKTRQVAGERYWLPTLNACLNGASGVLLIAGYLAIRRRQEARHKALMLAALGTSAAFLACYLYYHFVVLGQVSPRFPGEGWLRGLYLGILLTHTILAIVVAPLALYITYEGLRDDRPRHVRVARWTLPIWLYVSITGVVVYVMLYQLFPPY